MTAIANPHTNGNGHPTNGNGVHANGNGVHANGSSPIPDGNGHQDSLDADWPTLDELSLRYLHRVIEHSRGNKTKAAEVLGIDRRTVSRILSKVEKQGKTPTMQTANRK